MLGHRFTAGRTPGTYHCPECDATAHYDEDEWRYCVHPHDQDEPAFLVAGWDDPRIGSAHGERIRYRADGSIAYIG